MFDLYPWLAVSQQFLLQQQSVHRLPHALVFLGSKGLGKGRLIEWLAARLMCHQPTGDGACGHCKSCLLVAAGSHPDLIRVQSDKASIGVDLIRQANQKLSETAHQQGARVVLIEHADLMTESAANALLKTLEEPGKRCYLLLTAESNAQLLATINSRCQRHVVPVPDEISALNWLQQQGCQASVAYLRLNQGAPLKTQDFIQQGLHQKLVAFLVRMISVLKGYPASTALIDEAVADLPHSFDWLSALLLDVQKVVAGLGAEHLMFADHWTELHALAQQGDFQCPDWAPWLAEWQTVFRASGLNMKLQWQALFTELSLGMTHGQKPLKSPSP